MVCVPLTANDKANAWLNSPKYAPARSLRHKYALSTMVVLEGVRKKSRANPLPWVSSSNTAVGFLVSLWRA
jgi:hypothetical protein